MMIDSKYELMLALVATCGTCNKQRPVKGLGVCPVCGDALMPEQVKTVRAAVRRRRNAFKGRLVRLNEQMQRVTDAKLPFKKRGVPLSVDDHLNDVLEPALNAVPARAAKLQELFATGQWNPDEEGCIEAFTQLVGVLSSGFAAVTELRETMPPIEWRSVHRELVRASSKQVRAEITMAMTIIAPDADEAAKLEAEANQLLKQAARHVARVTALIRRISTLPSDGPFQLDGSLDVAALTWASVGESGPSIATAAAIVREAFAEIPDMSALADTYVLFLLPLLASTAREVDHELLTERATQLRGVLGATAGTAWIVEPELLVARVHRGLERIMDEAERLGRQERYGLPRQDVMRSLSEAFRQLVEGAMRDLGGVILVAARTLRGDDNGTYEYEVVEGIQAGEVVSEFERLGGPCGQAIDMLYRNASAHADFEVTSSGVVARERRIENGRVVAGGEPVTLSDAEFSEEYVALQELLLALQLAILPWLWSNTDPRVAAALTTMPLSVTQRNRTIALIAGMAGLYDVAVTEVANEVTVTASAHENTADRREIGYLTVVPAVFGAMPQAGSVKLAITGRQPVRFESSEFAGTDVGGLPHELPLLGLTTAKWYLTSGAPWTERDEATYVSFPLTMLHFSCMRLAGGRRAVS